MAIGCAGSCRWRHTYLKAMDFPALFCATFPYAQHIYSSARLAYAKKERAAESTMVVAYLLGLDMNIIDLFRNLMIA
jgi:hypothetical protein